MFAVLFVFDIIKCGQYIRSIGSDSDGVLKMGGEAAVARDDCPPVREDVRLLARLGHGDHRLYRNRHAGPEDELRPGLAVVGHLGATAHIKPYFPVAIVTRLSRPQQLPPLPPGLRKRAGRTIHPRAISRHST